MAPGRLRRPPDTLSPPLYLLAVPPRSLEEHSPQCPLPPSIEETLRSPDLTFTQW
ncbi:hypothetical protein GGP96_002082 [Salinibacter ruber]|nr:hypothetical protein [Salinibacter ruber]